MTRRGEWPAKWISCTVSDPSATIVAGYALRFSVSRTDRVSLQVSADQQYELYLDGALLGRGPEASVPEAWCLDAYEVELAAGPHVLAAKVWSWSDDVAPMALMSVCHGFHLAADVGNVSLDTGTAPWMTKRLTGIDFAPLVIIPNGWMGVAPSQILDAAQFPWDWITGEGSGWERALDLNLANGEEGRQTRAMWQSSMPRPLSHSVSGIQARFVSQVDDASLPLISAEDATDQHGPFERLFQQANLILPPGATRRAIFDLGDYYCAYPELLCSGGKGCRIRFTWAESLFTHADGMEKGQRDEVFGKYFRGIWDEFLLDGTTSRTLSPLAWRAGRFLELVITNAQEPVTLEGIFLTESRHPLSICEVFESDSNEVNRIIPTCARTLQLSSHDTFVDCPYYERLLYSGDGRIESLVAFAAAGDETLARKAIELFSLSASHNDLSMSRWPSRIVQYIPSFSLWWICMVHDFARWRDEPAFVTSVLPQVRSTLSSILSRRDSDGLMVCDPDFWNFIDWVPEWNSHIWGGTPPAADGISAIANWILVYTLRRAAELEDHAGDPSLGRHYRSLSANLTAQITQRFWNEEKSLFADDGTHRFFSQHCQIMAILCDALPSSEVSLLLDKTLATPGLASASLFFTHYLFDACFHLNRPSFFFNKLSSWRSFLDQGFLTIPENFENTRSDCHGWGSHPIYHLLAHVAGIRPDSMSFKTVRIAPCLGSLRKVTATCMHPMGPVQLRLSADSRSVSAEINLPSDVAGSFHFASQRISLVPGFQTFQIEK